MLQIHVNGKSRDIPGPMTVQELVGHLDLGATRVAVAVGDAVLLPEQWEHTQIQAGDQVEIVRAVGGGASEARWSGVSPYVPAEDPVVIGGRTFTSRLFCGTGKFRTAAEMQAAHARAGTEMVTVAIRYMDFEADGGGDILRHLDQGRYHLLPNTAGAYTADQAVKMAHLARAATGTNWIKLEVIGDQQTLLPDLQGTLEAAGRLIRDGFVVLAYTTADLITCLRLADLGCAAIMPLASPIGTGQGLVDWPAIRRVVERLSGVPVVVDAGIGCATDAAQAMETGAAAVLVNTAIAKADNPALMAEAMKWAVVAGRQSYLSGRMAKQECANPSSPTTGVPVAGLRRTGEVE